MPRGYPIGELLAYDNLMSPYWHAPAGTPPAIIQQISDILRPGLASPEMQTMMKKLGVIPRPGTPADFGAFLARESTKWQTVAKNAGIRIK
jgi:tripartite-type tricarboxylate transporter receptor subunit TctC